MSQNPASSKGDDACFRTTSSMTPLAVDFTPGPFDVICARGKDACNHAGNKRHRKRVQQAMEACTNSKSHAEKSAMVGGIVDFVQSSGSGGGFVKQVNGVWHKIGDHMAREKVGQGFRDGLHSLCRSSSKAKRKRRDDLGHATEADRSVQSLDHVASRMKQVSDDLGQLGGAKAPEMDASNVFTEANTDILEEFQKDPNQRIAFNEVKAAEKERSTKAATSQTANDDHATKEEKEKISLKTPPSCDSSSK